VDATRRTSPDNIRRRLLRSAATAAALPPLDPPRTVRWFDCGLQPYAKALAWQKGLANARFTPTRRHHDVVLALEHRHVFTLGPGAKEEDVRYDINAEPSIAEVYRVERGGQVTYHGPGQLVVYPILQLQVCQLWPAIAAILCRFSLVNSTQNFKQDLHWYVTTVEQVIIDTLGVFGVLAARAPGFPGVWVGDEKIAQIGVSCSKWVTSHGFAINVCPDMAFFERIVPCGIHDRGVTSMACVLGSGTELKVADVRDAVQTEFAYRFGCHVEVLTGQDPSR